MWPLLLGGIGVFLLGMSLLTDGLKAIAGHSLKAILVRFAGNRVSAAITGAVTTAVIQSSSAVSLLTIGLVASGLLGLTQAIAVLIGANVGTTATAYLVSSVGLKFSLSQIALPLVGVGALGRILGRGRFAAVSGSLTGFGLLFIGIDWMQEAMADLAQGFDLAVWGQRGALGLVVLVIAGIIMTILMQSSSAAMATTLAALAGGVIDLTAGAYLVIGQNVGTTSTALIGSIGAGASGKRVAAAHAVFNLGTAIPALLMAPWLLQLLVWLAPADPPLLLALFHTTFNVLGLLIFLPLAPRLAQYLQHRIAASKSITRRLTSAVLETPGGAGPTVEATLEELSKEAVHLIRARLSPRRGRDFTKRLAAGQEALAVCQAFLELARDPGGHLPSIVRTMDHLSHIFEELEDPIDATPGQRPASLGGYVGRFEAILEDVAGSWQDRALAEKNDVRFQELVDLRKSTRRRLLDGLGERSEVESTRQMLDLLHWIGRIAWHLRRVPIWPDAPRSQVAAHAP